MYDIFMAEVDCRHFNGYKPCGFSERCDTHCEHKSVPSLQVLVVHLGALGAVTRSTCILPLIRRKYPNCMITWVTDAPAQHLLCHNPYIDRVLTTGVEDLLKLECLEFEIGFCVDKSLKAVALTRKACVEKIYGFSALGSGAIVPATPAAEELWELGLDNHRKFYVNLKPETRLMVEAFELGEYRQNEYQVFLNEEEKKKSQKRRNLWKGSRKYLLGLNTGCSNVMSHKKLSVEYQRDLVQEILVKYPDYQIVLLGGPEDCERNQAIGEDLPVILSPCDLGLRDGLISMQAMDMVISGDSLGMHMAIALKKWVVAWFGPTCSHEIELYGRGVAVLSQVSCGPCWRRSCQKDPMCYDLVFMKDFLRGIESGEKWLQSQITEETFLSKQLLLEISY